METAVVLAGTIPHIEVLKNLKRRGYRTVLIDFNDNCPARAYADRFVNESTLDMDAVLKTAAEEHASLVISIVGDHINAVCCYVAEKLNLPHPYSYEQALKATRKSLMKPLFKEYNIPTSDYYVLDKNDERNIRMDFPLVVKPSDANSSRGVFRVNNEEEFFEKIEQSFSCSREGKVVVEQYADGVEIQVDCIAVHGKAYLCMIKDLSIMAHDGHELQTSDFAVPGNYCTQYKDQILQIAQRIADAYHLDSGAFFYQAKCSDRGVCVIEAAARMAGGTTFEAAGLCSDCDYIDLAIDGFLGNEITRIPELNDRKFVGKFLTMKPGTFGSLIGTEDLLLKSELIRTWVFMKPGTTVTESHVGGNRVAAIMAECDDYEEGFSRLNAMLKKISILDIDGNDLSDWK